MKVEVKSTSYILDDFFKVEEAYVSHECFDGTMSPVIRRLNFERGDSVAALIFNRDTERVLLVSQFKYPTYAKGPGWITETVAGIISSDESAEDAVRREVLEETGYEIENLEHIRTFYLSPGGSSERIILFYAEVSNAGKVGPGGGLSTEGEDIIVVELPLGELPGRLSADDVADAKTLIGLQWLHSRFAGG